MTKQSRQKPDVHPKVVARAFGVHLRTVFRWAKKGHLILRQCRIDRETALIWLRGWKASYSKAEARHKLRVRAFTVSLWIHRDILESVYVCGTQRLTKASVNKVLSLPYYRPGAKRVLLVSSRVAKQRQLIEVDEASRILGLPAWKVLPLFYRRHLNGELVGNRPKLYKSSVEQYKSRMGTAS